MYSATEASASNMMILVTGAAGFIGSFLCRRLLSLRNCTVVGLDNLNEYYDKDLKQLRLRMVQEAGGENFIFVKGDISDCALIDEVFDKYRFEIVVNLAAQAGVRYSIDSPQSYIESNIVGFFNILEACRRHPVKHLVYASSSSVYGANEKIPFSESDKVDRPVSLYAATKKSNELMAYAYSKLYGIPCTGLRFFTVYGPLGRPDMAYFKFAKALVHGESIKIFNMGNCVRDFTYIDDIIDGVVAVLGEPPTSDDLGARYEIFNIGGSNPIPLLQFVSVLQDSLITVGLLPEDFDFEEHCELLPMQPGDVEKTYADASKLEDRFGERPLVSLEDGMQRFAEWYNEYIEHCNDGLP